MATLLAEYLAARSRERSGNCFTFVADWVRLATGVDPAAEWRGTDQGDVAWLKMRGGKRTASAAAMASAGLVPVPPVAPHKPGDVALARVTMPDRKLLAGAICVHADQWAVICSDMAFVIAGPPAIVPEAVWSVGWPNR